MNSTLSAIGAVGIGGPGAALGAIPGMLSGGPTPVNTAYNTNPDGTINSWGFGYGGMQSPAMLNPQGVNPYTANPYAGAELSNLQGLQGAQGQIMSEAFDPSYYNSLKANAITGSTTSIDNQYAKMGLAGSSANLGADSSSINNLNQYYLNRQMGDQEHAIQGMAGLDNSMYGDIMGIQGQYGDFQNGILDTLVGLNNSSQEQQMANNQMMANLMGSAMGAAGSYAGMRSRGMIA